jgi:hypothetical protein
MTLTGDELALGIKVYAAASAPVIVLSILYLKGKLSRWIGNVSALTFVIYAFGWELWFTYGWVAGQSVSERRSDALNAAIPQNINWLVNSTADVGIGLFGLMLVWLFFGKTTRAFRQWNWTALAILFAWFMAQNTYVEMVLYAKQLTSGTLSWAPLAPTGPWFNPILFEIGDVHASLQGQIPWIIMTPLFYWITIRVYNRSANKE